MTDINTPRTVKEEALIARTKKTDAAKARARLTKKGISGGALKTALMFVVTVDNRIVAAFAHPSDATDFTNTRRASRPDLTYHIISQ